MITNAIELAIIGFSLSVGFTLTTGPGEIFSFIRQPFKKIRPIQRLFGCGKCLSAWFTIVVSVPFLLKVNPSLIVDPLNMLSAILAVCMALLFGKIFDKYIL